MDYLPHTDDQRQRSSALGDAKQMWEPSAAHFKDVLENSASHFEVLGSTADQPTTSETDLSLAVNSIKAFIKFGVKKTEEDAF